MAGRKQHNWVYAEVTLLQKRQLKFLAEIVSKRLNQFWSPQTLVERMIESGIELEAQQLTVEERQKFDALT